MEILVGIAIGLLAVAIINRWGCDAKTDDREFLQQQVVELRAEVAKLRADIEDLRDRSMGVTVSGHCDAQDVLYCWAMRFER